MDNMPIPSVSIMTLRELDVHSQSKSTNGSSTLAFQVLLSTRKVFVASQLDDKANADLQGGTFLGGSTITELSCEYAGMTAPNLRFSDSNNDQMRAYLELHRGKLFTGESSFDMFTSWQRERLYGLTFSKDSSDTSTNLIVRMAAAASGYPCQIYVGAFWTQALTITYGIDGFITSVNTSVLN